MVCHIKRHKFQTGLSSCSSHFCFEAGRAQYTVCRHDAVRLTVFWCGNPPRDAYWPIGKRVAVHASFWLWGTPGLHRWVSPENTPFSAFFSPMTQLKCIQEGRGIPKLSIATKTRQIPTSFGGENPFGRSRFEKSCIFFAKYWDLFENKTTTTKINA